MSREHWQHESANWAAWARRPDFDEYWKYSQAFFDLVPPPGIRTLEIGCGEGRVSRDLAARGHRVRTPPRCHLPPSHSTSSSSTTR
jgi:2-polyprenyl-3-methyl-5-hydroxy-6-metoxy-1,4-benzoquinol methylase